ncbi:HLH transcription factor (PalcA), putative [Talaromyces stipitatus ATCC 10500]|uniref:HLH transcription factor (PalcA), putative n=1 Tax=Talaromyces stipitatus (strain ATCC 10500 / CBS 375.48 / QM 6759 / NRRL 1006) TaxID=441959 RepID=B8MFQ4_TALSN|nr:HLH transcription factor (PalcA), putative [Talaromyces stipitatus ATCC 10500]EED17044.1 HLH transcription factor (PalcA), putative [Talaromyces stipitatus ATCC 10500]
MAMDHDTAMTWSEQLPEETLMATGNEEDFSNFLEFGIDFADLDNHNAAAAVQHQQAMQHANQQIATTLPDDVRMASSTTQPPSYPSMMGEHIGIGMANNRPVEDPSFHYSQDQQQQQYHQQLPAQHHQHPEKLVHQQGQQLTHPHPHPPMASHQYQEGQHIIPPTPNSVELHGGAARYMQRVDQNNNDMYERYGQMNDEQAAAFYTPLVSPAMTPLESQFRLPEYTIPGEYFTPLTSPALEAQNHSSSNYPFQTTQPHQNGGYVSAPHDPSGLTMTSAPPSPAVFKKQRQGRRPSTATRAGGRAAKASPSIQAKSWKKQSRNPHLLSDDVVSASNHTNLQEQNTNRYTNSGLSALRYSSNESSQDSVSPEPISEPLMPPPALPHKSPAILPQSSDPGSSAPATPATLMKITNRPQHLQDSSGQFSGQASLIPSSEPHDEPMEDMVLPEAAADTRRRPSRINTAIITKEQPSNKSATNTPLMEPLSRQPSGSLTPGPRSSVMPSPSGPVPKKSEPKASTTRKRQSISSSHASPALRPRISPSIQPLVRGDGMTSESSALYLASKSNYQHILDGTVLPGVSYPETLAENLSSKRTNHKLAEQGRRNRINTALKEIEALLPPDFAHERAMKESKDGNGAGKNSDGKEAKEAKEKSTPPTISKASTVEMAIDYIKALKKELEETKAQLQAAETKLAGGQTVKPDDSANTTDNPTKAESSPTN